MDELRKHAATWRVTAESIEAAVVPQAVSHRITMVRERIDEVGTLVADRMQRFLALQDRAVTARVTVSDGIALVERAEESARESLFEVEGVPLWRAFNVSARPHSVWAEIRESWTRMIQGSRSFYRDYHQRTVVALALFVGLVAGFWLLGQRARTYLTGDP